MKGVKSRKKTQSNKTRSKITLGLEMFFRTDHRISGNIVVLFVVVSGVLRMFLKKETKTKIPEI